MMATKLLLAAALGVVARAQDCTQGADCGGQVMNECGTACPLICGEPAAGMCTMNCVAEYQCPGGQCFDARAGACSGVESQTVELPTCVQGADCGGQVMNDCGTACPLICGQPAPEMCTENCVSEHQCPNGQCFDERAGVCESLWCAESPPQTCRMLCPELAPCRPGQCHMRLDNCCESSCQDVSQDETPTCTTDSDCPRSADESCGYSCGDGQCAMWCHSEPPPTVNEECTCCPEGAECFAPDPPCCSARGELEKCYGAAEPLTDSAGVELNCGRSVSRVDCPTDSTCHVHPADAWAVCCPGGDSGDSSTEVTSTTSIRSQQGSTDTSADTSADTQDSTAGTIVRATLSLEGELEAVAGTEGSPAREQFKADFAADVATHFQIDAERIIVDTIVSGSVVVTFDIMPDSDDRNIEVSTVQTAFAEAGVPLSRLQLTTAGPASGVLAYTTQTPETGLNASPGPPTLQARAGGAFGLSPAVLCGVAAVLASIVLA